MGNSKKRYGELRFVDFGGAMKTWKKVEKRKKGGWEHLGIINCKKEDFFVSDYRYFNIDDMEEIIMYIKLNREIWRRYAFPSANVLGLSVKRRMSVADTKRLPVESYNYKINKQNVNVLKTDVEDNND